MTRTRTAKKPAPPPAAPSADPAEDPVVCSRCDSTAYLVVPNRLTGTTLVLNGPDPKTSKSHPCALAATVAVLTVDPATGATVAPLKEDARAYIANALRGVLAGPAEWAATATRQLKGHSVVVLTRGSVPTDLYGAAE